MSVLTNEGARALLVFGRVAFAAALVLFVLALFFVLRRDAGGGNGGA